jgi:hypothetical protein
MYPDQWFKAAQKNQANCCVAPYIESKALTEKSKCLLCGTNWMANSELQKHCNSTKHAKQHNTLQRGAKMYASGCLNKPYLKKVETELYSVDKHICTLCDSGPMDFNGLASHLDSVKHKNLQSKREPNRQGSLSGVIPIQVDSRPSQEVPGIAVEQPYFTCVGSTWECMLCKKSGLQLDQLVMHCQEPKHKFFHAHLHERSLPIIEKVAWTKNEWKWKCKLCVTEATPLSTLISSHFVGSKHRRQFDKMIEHEGQVATALLIAGTTTPEFIIAGTVGSVSTLTAISGSSTSDWWRSTRLK